MVGEEQVGEADDRGQHVVEVVGDAAGELADRLHLLALRELLLERALLGDVEGVDDHRVAAVGAVLDGVDVEAGAPLALAGDRHVDRRDDAGPPRRRIERRGDRRAVGLRDEIDQLPATVPPSPRLPNRRRKAALVRPIRAAPVDRGDGDRRVVEEAGEADLGGAERLRRLPRPGCG